MKKTKEQVLQIAVDRCREMGVILPTFKQQANPTLVPETIVEKLKKHSIWDRHPLNLFRITWKNQQVADPQTQGSGFGDVNFVELPSELTGTKARIFVLTGKYFPTGAHKVGATYGPLIKKITIGEFDPTTQKAIWPSTGNYCRGGAYDSALLGYSSIAILPEEMSAERFSWLKEIGAEVFATPGCESNVKEIYDKVKELLAERGDAVINFNQFEDFGNPLWHFNITGRAMKEVFDKFADKKDRLAGVFLTQGSAGTLSACDYLKKYHNPTVKLGVGEALQCPTLLYNGFGGHRIEGIGDKHVPWVHNLKTSDMVIGIDDNPNIRIMRLFNSQAGQKYLSQKGVSDEILSKLNLLGISGIANVMGTIKMAKYYEMTSKDCLFTVATDSMEMYQSRLAEQEKLNGKFTQTDAAVSYDSDLMGLDTQHTMELSYLDKKRMHNLKYFTWIEQQGKSVEEINAQWYDEDYWLSKIDRADYWDEKINEFNDRVGLLKKLK